MTFGVTDRGRRLGLALEASDDLGLASELLMEELHGEALLVQARVAGLVDPTHPALARGP